MSGVDENMKTRGTQKTAAPDFLSSPPTASPDLSLTDSPPFKFSFNLNTVNIPTNSATKATSSSKKTKRNNVNKNNPRSIADLKDIVSSRLKAVKEETERSHSAFVKDVDAFDVDLRKGLEIQRQRCEIAKDEAGKECKKFNEIRASYVKLIEEAQASSSRVFDTSIPNLVKSLDNSVESLRSRYGNASNLG